MSKVMQLTSVQEDYLESIYQLLEDMQVARVKDIAAHLKVHKSTVTGALRGLADMKLINYAPYAKVSLTLTGKQAAIDIVRRHESLQEFFSHVLGISGEAAEEAACRMEHAMSPIILRRLTEFQDFLRGHPEFSEKWLIARGTSPD